MGTDHIVKEGEYLSRIADEYGFRDYATIWDHPDNAQLKTDRGTPDVLLAGDKVVIPDKRTDKQSAETDQIHRFVLQRQALLLRVAMLDFHEVPLASTDCTLEVEGSIQRLKTDGDGVCERPIPVRSATGVLTGPNLNFPLRIGFLDPIDVDAGWQARLLNLGYLNSDVPCDDLDELKAALEEFQCNRGLGLSGQPDADTLAAIKDAYGC